MAAVYPSGIKNWPTPVQDAVDTVYAAHINDLRDEVTAIESEIGTGLKTSTWTGAFAQSASWGSLSLRLANIERGLVSTSDVHTQYAKKTGDTMTGDLTMESGGANDRWLRFTDGDVVRWRVGFGGSAAGTDALIVQRYDGSGVFVDQPLIVTAAGRVLSSSHVGDVFTGTVNGARQVVIPLPASPTGRWSLSLNPVAPLGQALIVSETATSVVVDPRTPGGLILSSGDPVTIHWHAIAY